VKMEWNREPGWHQNSRHRSVHKLTEIRGLCTEPDYIACALMPQIRESIVVQIGVRRYQIGPLDPLTIPSDHFFGIRRLQLVRVLQNFKPDVFTFELFENAVCVLDVSVGNGPRLSEQVYVRKRRRGFGIYHPGQRGQLNRGLFENDNLIAIDY